MTTMLDEAFAKVRELPDDEQALAARLLFAVARRRSYRSQLSPHQVEEVERLDADLSSGREAFMSDAEIATLRHDFGL